MYIKAKHWFSPSLVITHQNSQKQSIPNPLSMAQLQPGSVLMSKYPATIKGCAEPKIKGQVSVSEPYFQRGQWWHSDPAAAKDRVQVYAPTTSGVLAWSPGPDTNGHIDAQGWGHNLRLWWCPTTTQLSKPFSSEWSFTPPRARKLSRPTLLPKTMSGSMVQLHLGVCVDVCGQWPLRRP